MKRVNTVVFPFVVVSLFCIISTAYSGSNPFISSHGINFAIGNKYYQETDVRIDGPVAPLTFTRHYNSLSTVDGTLGYGWSHSFADSISVTASLIRYSRPDGRVVDYEYDSGSTSWVKDVGKIERITEEVDGYYLRESDGTIKKFDLSTGALFEVVDRYGNTTSLDYSVANEVGITDNFGRWLTLNYHGTSGRLIELETPVGSYIYNNTSGNLDSVQRPGNTTSRQYSYSGNNLTGMTDEEGNIHFSASYNNDQVTSSSLYGGINPITIDYTNLDSGVVVVTDVTNSTDTTYNLTYKHGIAQVESFTGPGCSSCGGNESSSYVHSDRLQIESETKTKVDEQSNTINITTSYTYDSNGNRDVVTEYLSDGSQYRQTDYDYNLTTNLLNSITKASVGNCGQQSVVSWTYDGVKPDYKTETGCSGSSTISRTTDYTYDSLGRIEYIDGPRTDLVTDEDDITFQYYTNSSSEGNKQGMLWKVTNGLGHVVEYLQYSTLRKPTLIEDHNGVQTTLTYNNFGQLRTSTVGTRTIEYVYDDAGKLDIIHLPESRDLDYEYHTNGKVEYIYDDVGNYIKYSYDDLGNPSGREIRDSEGTHTASINYIYDLKSRLSKTYDGIGSDITKPAEELIYDNFGNLTERIILKDYDTNTYLTTKYTYDDLDRLWKIKNPGSSVDNTIFGYDLHDNQISVEDDNGVVTTYEFDDFGRKISEKITENSVENLIANYQYDLADNLRYRADGNGDTVEYQYDALNRLTDIIFADSTQDISYSYDEVVESISNYGRLTSMDDASGSTIYKYNTYGELVKETRTTEGRTFITEYSYNDNGELDYIIYPSGRQITYNRRTTGQLLSIDSLYQQEDAVVAQSIYSKPFGPITRMTLGNGLSVINNYDTLYRLGAAVVSGLYDKTYSYWSNSQIRSITDGIDHDNDQSFTYDNLGHLDVADGAYGNLDFDHDGVGNRTYLTEDLSSTAYGYATGSNRLNSVDDGTEVTYGYDNIGNITTVSQDTTVFNWSDDYRLQSVTQNAATVGSYKYDGNGLRTVKTAGSGTTLFIYDKEGNLFAEADNQGNILKEYVYADGKLLAHFQYGGGVSAVSSSHESHDEGSVGEIGTTEITGTEKTETTSSSVSALTPDVNTAILIQIYHLLMLADGGPSINGAEGAYYYISDHLGTPQIITDDTGAVAWKGTYSPFGEVAVDPSNTIINNIRMPGQYFDDETALFFNWNRYYSSETGRYISADPIGLSGGINLYAYANGDPLMSYDSDGKNPVAVKAMIDSISDDKIEEKKKCWGDLDDFDKWRHCYVVCKGKRAELVFPYLGSIEIAMYSQDVFYAVVRKKDSPSEAFKDFWRDAKSDYKGSRCAYKFWLSCDECCDPEECEEE